MGVFPQAGATLARSPLRLAVGISLIRRLIVLVTEVVPGEAVPDQLESYVLTIHNQLRDDPLVTITIARNHRDLLAAQHPVEIPPGHVAVRLSSLGRVNRVNSHFQTPPLRIHHDETVAVEHPHDFDVQRSKRDLGSGNRRSITP